MLENRQKQVQNVILEKNSLKQKLLEITELRNWNYVLYMSHTSLHTV